MQILVVTAADAGDKIGKVILICSTAPLAKFFAVVIEGDTRRIVRANRIAFGSVPDVGSAFDCACFEPKSYRRLDWQTSHVRNQDGIVPLVDRHLLVGHIAVVDVSQPAAKADHML